MAYTVQHLYDKVMEGVDKIGSDLYTIPYVLRRLEAVAHDFIGETVKFIENTQEIRDDLRTLYKPFYQPLITIPVTQVGPVTAPTFVGFALPSDYQHLMSAKVIDANVTVRDTRIVRHGQDEIYHTDPNKKPAAEYPLLVLHEDYIRIYSPGNPTHLQGFYIKKPIVWKFDEEGDFNIAIAINLPDHSVDKLIKDIINDIFIASGDPRAQFQNVSKEQYRKRARA